jgi:hypothetical protein
MQGHCGLVYSVLTVMSVWPPELLHCGGGARLVSSGQHLLLWLQLRVQESLSPITHTSWPGQDGTRPFGLNHVRIFIFSDILARPCQDGRCLGVLFVRLFAIAAQELWMRKTTYHITRPAY